MSHAGMWNSPRAPLTGETHTGAVFYGAIFQALLFAYRQVSVFLTIYMLMFLFAFSSYHMPAGLVGSFKSGVENAKYRPPAMFAILVYVALDLIGDLHLATKSAHLKCYHSMSCRNTKFSRLHVLSLVLTFSCMQLLISPATLQLRSHCLGIGQRIFLDRSGNDPLSCLYFF